MRARLWLLAAAAVCLAGCGHPASGAGTAAAATTRPPFVAVITSAGTAPTAIRIPRIGASSSLSTVGLDSRGVIEVPPVSEPMQAAWYRWSPVPGAAGPAVIVGHINGGGHPGIFARLSEVHTGDTIEVDRTDRKRLTYTVTRTELADKAAFPTDAVYGDTPGSTLRLLSCGGRLDRKHHRYLDQVIVYADLTDARGAP